MYTQPAMYEHKRYLRQNTDNHPLSRKLGMTHLSCMLEVRMLLYPSCLCREPSSAGQSVAEIEAAVQAEQTAKLLERRTAEVDAEREAVIKLQK
jgi:hypothetical protein